MYLSVDGRDGAGADRNGRRDELPAKAEQTAGDLVNVERGCFCAGATSEQNRKNSTGRVSLAPEQKFKNMMPATAVCCLLWCLFKILAQTFGHKSVSYPGGDAAIRRLLKKSQVHPELFLDCLGFTG